MPSESQICSCGSWICVVMTSWWLSWLSWFHPKFDLYWHLSVNTDLRESSLTTLFMHSGKRPKIDPTQKQMGYLIRVTFYVDRLGGPSRVGDITAASVMVLEQTERMQTCAWMNWRGNNTHGRGGKWQSHSYPLRTQRTGFYCGFYIRTFAGRIISELQTVTLSWCWALKSEI